MDLIYQPGGDLVPREAPQNVSVIEIHGKHLQIEWEPVNPLSVRGTFRGYLVRIWNHISSQVYAIPPDVTKASIEFFPYSKNFVTVSVRNNKFIGPPSDAISFDAPQGAPNYPKLFEAHQLGETSLLLQWSMPSQPNGILLGYKIYCTEINETYVDDKTAFSFSINDPLVSQTKLSNLRLGATYKIGIAAFNCAGESLTNYLDTEITEHTTSMPSVPDFKYQINYEEPDGELLCEESMSEKEDDEDLYGPNIRAEMEKNTTIKENCYVTTKITWMPDIDGNPGDYFYVKYRIKGAPEYFVSDPIFEKDNIILRHFNSCKNYEIIVVSVDGEYFKESEKIVTPKTNFEIM